MSGSSPGQSETWRQSGEIPGEDAHLSIECCFYVDNCLQSLPCKAQAKKLVDQLQSLLREGGFELRQWARNALTVIAHLPRESQSEISVLWFTQEMADPQEHTLGLVWQCKSDTLQYKHHQRGNSERTIRNIYLSIDCLLSSMTLSGSSSHTPREPRLLCNISKTREEDGTIPSYQKTCSLSLLALCPPSVNAFSTANESSSHCR